MKTAILCVVLALVSQAIAQQTCSSSPVFQKVAQTKPTAKSIFHIAGLFSVHEAGDSPYKCGNYSLAGIQFLEAFLWSVRKAKSRFSGLGPNTDVAAIGFDVCTDADMAVEQVLNFEKCAILYGSPTVSPVSTFAYIGPEDNVVSGVSQLISSLTKPNVAFTSSHSYLTAPGWSNYQLRTVPSDAKQVAAIVDILKRISFKVVQVVYSGSLMGKDRLMWFQKMAKAKGICIEQTLMVNPNDKEAKYREIIRSLKTKRKTRGVVLLLDRKIGMNPGIPYQVKMLLQAVTPERALHMFTWITTDAWDIDINNMEIRSVALAAQGAVVISPKIVIGTDKDAYDDFSTYFKSLRPGQNKDNPWFDEFWQQNFRCSLVPSASNKCLPTYNFNNIVIDPRVTYIRQAVDAIVMGVEAARSEDCKGADKSLCSAFINNIKRKVVTFDRILKADNKRIFNQTTRDAYRTRFIISNLRHPIVSKPFHYYQPIGEYSQDGDDAATLTLNHRDVFAYDQYGSNIDSRESTCDYLCKVCQPPTINPILPGQTTEDPNRPTTTPANSTQEPRPYYRVRKIVWIIPLMILSGLGILIVLCFEIYVLSKLIGTKAISKWRTMWLGQLLLVAVILAYMVCFLFAPSPSVATCGMIRFGVGASYSMMYSILLVKLMIILSSTTIGYLKGVYQVLMFLFAWGVQLVIDCQWLILVPPKTAWVDGRWQCIHETLVASQQRLYTAHVLSLVYCMFLVVVCTFIAIRTHGIITNHREGIFVGLAAGFSIPLWLAWVLVGQLNTNREFEDPSVAYGLFCCATLVLFVMFLPKVRQLNTLGIEGIYLEDDGEDREVYGSVMYGPPSYKSNKAGSVYMLNNGTYANANPAFLNSGTLLTHPEYSPDPHYSKIAKHSLYLRHPGSVKSAPGYRGTIGSAYGTKVLRTTRDLTGKMPLDNKAASEYGYVASTKGVLKTDKAMKAGTIKRAHSLTDLGAL